MLGQGDASLSAASPSGMDHCTKASVESSLVASSTVGAAVLHASPTEGTAALLCKLPALNIKGCTYSAFHVRGWLCEEAAAAGHGGMA
mmetsp:Transcript_133176/g.265695  ORF Transcript_133176/g.265695 Transcript_133176/m.265695 type:complete len:88 (-) Transcript_133176:778-1041(-)